MSLKRRTILQMIPATAALSVVSGQSMAASHHVVVVGGGFAGATVAKYLRMWSNGGIDVTLVDKNSRHVSCIMSNLVLNGQLQLGDLSFDYSTLQDKYGVRIVQGGVRRIAAGMVELESGDLHQCDYVVVATGISFDDIPGLDSRKIPHAWIAGEQTNLLRDQIREDMPRDNGTFVMTIPRAPYRCPPGPYERACLLADILRRRGDGHRVVVLDANDRIQAERTTFERAFYGLYRDIIDYRASVSVASVNSDERIVTTVAGENVHGDVVNVIPRHGAPGLLVESGLTGGGRWAPVNPTTYESSLIPGVYVVGDSQATAQPKSGHMANSQAKVCADAIIRAAAGLSTQNRERLANITTNSACFSPITATEASWLTAVFRLNTETRAMELVPESLGEAHDWNSENYSAMFDWSENLFADTFR